MKQKVFIVLILIILQINCAIDILHDDKLAITNSTNEIIYCKTTFDTSLINKELFVEMKKNDTIRPPLFAKGGDWKKMLEKFSKDSSLHLFIINKDTLNRHEWKYILKNKKFTKYSYNYQELDSLNWTITYP